MDSSKHRRFSVSGLFFWAYFSVPAESWSCRVGSGCRWAPCLLANCLAVCSSPPNTDALLRGLSSNRCTHAFTDPCHGSTGVRWMLLARRDREVLKLLGTQLRAQHWTCLGAPWDLSQTPPCGCPPWALQGPVLSCPAESLRRYRVSCWFSKADACWRWWQLDRPPPGTVGDQGRWATTITLSMSRTETPMLRGWSWLQYTDAGPGEMSPSAQGLPCWVRWKTELRVATQNESIYSGLKTQWL